ncbi:hypothetical protein C8J56DRAFT_895859 [Mycena floridula]|nr:hypothetical protein C8J56DRAFT_895859 [Mycena floridula]
MRLSSTFILFTSIAFAAASSVPDNLDARSLDSIGGRVWQRRELMRRAGESSGSGSGGGGDKDKDKDKAGGSNPAPTEKKKKPPPPDNTPGWIWAGWGRDGKGKWRKAGGRNRNVDRYND